MSATTLLFYLYSAIAVAGAVGLLVARRLAHAVMSLFVTLLSVSALYLLLGSEFLAAMQLFVYGGAITVLMLFVLMLAKPSPESVDSPGATGRWVAAATTLILFGVFATAIATSRFAIRVQQPTSTAALAETLFARYMLPFEIVGLLLTIALIGAIVLARGQRSPARAGGEGHAASADGADAEGDVQ